MNNSVYSITIETLRYIVDATPATNNKDYQKLMPKPRFVSLKIFSKYSWPSL